MDIDSPPTDTYDTPSHTHVILPGFTASFPLPFRVLTLVGLAILLWAINLHVLAALGLDTSRALGIIFRDDVDIEDDDAASAEEGMRAESRNSEEHDEIPLSNLHRRSPSSSFSSPASGTGSAIKPLLKSTRRPHPSSLYGPVYILFAIYSLWVGAGWIVFRMVTGGEVSAMERWRGLIVIIVVGVVAGAVMPNRRILPRERGALIASFRRIVMLPAGIPPYFCDVILSDILTSFAKVLGDLVISAWQLWCGGISRGRVRTDGWSSWVILAMVCLPYILRFRMCLQEYLLPTNNSVRPLANALKYASAFPVIFLSAAQRTVVKQIAEAKGVSVEELGATGGRWFGEHILFRLWLLAVLVNSMYSFWWDVTNDWGLSLVQPDTWFPTQDPTGPRPVLRLPLPAFIRRCLPGPDDASPHQRSPCPSPRPQAADVQPFSSFHGSLPSSGLQVNGILNGMPVTPKSTHLAEPATATTRSSRPNPLLFGLRSILLFPDPLVYHLFIFLDLVLRFTWSLKLSSHLHTISEIESGVFLMEALELGRRWMWVFLRVEWELVKQMEDAKAKEERDRSRFSGNVTARLGGRQLDGPSDEDFKAPIVR